MVGHCTKFYTHAVTFTNVVISHECVVVYVATVAKGHTCVCLFACCYFDVVTVILNHTVVLYNCYLAWHD